MFERLINTILKGGAKIGMIDELGSIAEHPRISIDNKDYDRIKENVRLYRADYPQVEYINSNGVKTKRDFHSLNMAKVVARKLSKLVFNEGVHIEVNDDAAADKFLKDVFTDSGFKKAFGEELEAGYAIGGLVLRPYFDRTSQSIKISYSKPDSFFPIHSRSNRNGFTEVCFTTRTTVTEDKKKVYYTLLEFHSWLGANYIIENELYRSESKDKLGIKRPLTMLDKYATLQPKNVMQGFSRPLFAYIKLAGKNNKNIYSPLSLGIIDNSKTQINDINEKYDQYMQEIKESKRRLLASEHFFRTRFDSNGRPVQQFDDDSSVFKTLRTDEPTLKEFAPELRAAEYVDTIDFILRVIEMQVGFSAGTFSFDGAAVKTATEIISEESETYSTRADNVQVIEEALSGLIISIFELAHYHNLYSKPNKLNVVIDFDDGVFQSTEAKLNFYGKAAALGFLPRVEGIQSIFGVSEKTALEWLQKINNEAMMNDPVEKMAAADKETFGIQE